MSATISRSRGFSLIELMIGITIGMLILTGLTTVFVNSSRSYGELRKTAEQIENGRYAIEFMMQDIRHAGFYGEFSTLPAVPGSAPDPCTAPTAGAVSDTSNSALALPVQGYAAADFATAASVPTACASLITSANIMAGSDILVVRRTDSSNLGVTDSTTGTTVANTVYLQTTSTEASIQLGGGGSIDKTKNATGGATTLFRRDVTAATAGTPPEYPQIAAQIRKYRTHIYFVAPCSVPTGGGAICTGATDDNGRPIPTLKRLEMGTSGAFSIVPIAEGIQTIRFEWGVDSSPSTVDAGTKLIGDSSPDSYTHTPTLADMGNTVAMRVHVLARNTSPTPGYTDDKTYTLGGSTTTAANDSYKRHVYSAESRLINPAGRREIPK
jgi:type IV pilus assembly protein PilW